MVDRLISVGDDFTLPASVKAQDVNLPDRLGEAALSSTFIPWRSTTLYITDPEFGVSTGTAVSQTTAIKAALDANPGKAFHFPPGDYRLDTGLVISQDNSLHLAPGCRLYAGAPMTTMITYFRAAVGYAEDRFITGYGWIMDGALKADRILSIGKIIRFSLCGGTFYDGIKRGLVTEAGVGAELIANDLRFENFTATNVADNIAIEAKMGDSHFTNIIARSWTVGIKDTGANRWHLVHPWIGPDQMAARYPTSIGFDLTGGSDMLQCMSDTYRTGVKTRDNGSGFTPLPRLRACRIAWTDAPSLPQSVIDANQAYVIDNTDGAGANISDLTIKGHNTGAPVQFLTGPTTKLNIRNTMPDGFVIGAQGTTTDSFDYRNGVQQGSFTFTPTLIGSTSSTNAHTYTTQSGRMVVTPDAVTYFLHIEATLDAAGTFSGSLRIAGIPLPYGATGVRNSAGSVGYSINVNASGAVMFATTGTPFVALMTMDAAGQSEVSVGLQALRGKSVKIMVTATNTHYKS